MLREAVEGFDVVKLWTRDGTTLEGKLAVGEGRRLLAQLDMVEVPT